MVIDLEHVALLAEKRTSHALLAVDAEIFVVYLELEHFLVKVAVENGSNARFVFELAEFRLVVVHVVDFDRYTNRTAFSHWTELPNR